MTEKLSHQNVQTPNDSGSYAAVFKSHCLHALLTERPSANCIRCSRPLDINTQLPQLILSGPGTQARNCQQVCTLVNPIIVDRSLANSWLEKLRQMQNSRESKENQRQTHGNITYRQRNTTTNVVNSHNNRSSFIPLLLSPYNLNIAILLEASPDYRQTATGRISFYESAASWAILVLAILFFCGMCNNAFFFRRPVAEQTSYSRVTVNNQATSTTTRLACSSEDSVKSINCITHHLLPISLMNSFEVSIYLSLSMMLENWLRGVFLAFINVVLCVKGESLVGRCESFTYLHRRKPRIGKDKRILVWSETKVNYVEQDLTVTILHIRRLGMKEV